MNQGAKNAAGRGMRGLTLTEVLVVLGVTIMLVILYVVMLPYMRNGRGVAPSQRTVCAANLRGTGNGFATLRSCQQRLVAGARSHACGG